MLRTTRRTSRIGRPQCGTAITVMVWCLAISPHATALPEHIGRHAQGRTAEQADSLLFRLQGSGGPGG